MRTKVGSGGVFIWSHADLVGNLQTPETVSTLWNPTTGLPWTSSGPLAPPGWVAVFGSVPSLQSLSGVLELGIQLFESQYCRFRP